MLLFLIFDSPLLYRKRVGDALIPVIELGIFMWNLRLILKYCVWLWIS